MANEGSAVDVFYLGIANLNVKHGRESITRQGRRGGIVHVTVDRERKSEVALIFCLQLQTEYTREVLPHGPPVD
jgi:hypothetical protein